jgi:hypothetical protein
MCTTGFGVHSPFDGKAYLLTAGHCGAAGEQVRTGAGGVIGPITRDDNRADTLLVATRAGNEIFDGPYTTTDARPVVGAAPSYVGEAVCTSGSLSGTICGITVVATDVTINVGSYLIDGVTKAERAGRAAAAGNGDSGGPVYSPSESPGPNGERGSVVAKGTVTAIDPAAAAPCPGVPSGRNRRCSWRVYYAETATALARYSLVIGGR